MENSSERSEAPEILVVETDLFFAVRIETTLQKLGYAVYVARTGGEAISRAEQCLPALVIIDFGREHLVPGEVVKRIKSLPHAPPVLGFVSHKWIPQVRPNALAAGCDLLVANSALSMRLPQLVAKLAPRDGANIDIREAAQLAAESEEADQE